MPVLTEDRQAALITHSDAEQTVENLEYRIPIIERKIRLLQDKLTKCRDDLDGARSIVSTSGSTVHGVEEKITGCCIRYMCRYNGVLA